MATEKMAIRKFLKQNVAHPTQSARARLAQLSDEGYIIVSNLVEYDGGSFRSFKLIDSTRNKADEWCTNMFGLKHWSYVFNHWVFTKQDDATLFKLTWL